MSDAMLLGVLRMPEEMITGSTLSLVQFINRAYEAADRIESDAALIDEFRNALDGLIHEFVKVFPIYYYAEPWAHDRNEALKVARAALAKAGAAP